MKTAVFDIETSDLAAVGAGILLCAVVKPVGKKGYVFRADDYSEPLGKEFKLLQDVIECLVEFDLWVGHNIVRFDIPWLKSRAVQLGLESFPFPLVYDTMKAFGRIGYLTVPNMIGRPTKRLDHVVDFFHIPQRKTPIYPVQHWSTVWGDKAERKEAMDKLVDHCRRDVDMNALAYPLLLKSDYRAQIKRVI